MKTKKIKLKKEIRRAKTKVNGEPAPFLENYVSKSAKSGITKIKVVGVGGGGGNAITRMMEGDRIKGVEFIAANTDAQDLNFALAHKKIYMGRALTRGLGAGMNPEIGKKAAEENQPEISELLSGADVVFITAGMGGGTGSGAAPVIAEIAKEKGILTVAFVTKPFAFEGSQRMNIAQEALFRLKERVDALVVIPNDRIFEIIDKDTSLKKAFSFIDTILKNAVLAIAELVNIPGIINVDFADIKAIMKDAGTTLIGIGIGSGEDRAAKAVNGAINSPLLETSIEGARGVLFCVSGGADLKMAELNEIAKAIAASIDPGAKVIFGASQDRRLKEKNIKVTVIATGFNGVLGMPHLETPTLFSKKTIKETSVEDLFGRKKTAPDYSDSDSFGGKDEDEKTVKDDDNTWEIPTFLRLNKKNKELDKNPDQEKEKERKKERE